MQIATEVRGKAIFVDGPSANRTKQALGVRDVNFSALHSILLHRVGACRVLAFPPVVTADPGQVVIGQGLAKYLSGAGFDIVPIKSRDGADDDYIKSRILQLEPEKVSEIVVMSSDKYFVPVLRTKASQGIRVHWVSTMRPHPGTGRHGFSNDVLGLFKSGEFQFTELAPFARQITLVRLGAKSCLSCAEDHSVTKVTLTLKDRNSREHLRLMNEIQRLVGDFGGLTFNVDQ